MVTQEASISSSNSPLRNSPTAYTLGSPHCIVQPAPESKVRLSSQGLATPLLRLSTYRHGHLLFPHPRLSLLLHHQVMPRIWHLSFLPLVIQLVTIEDIFTVLFRRVFTVYGR